MKIHGHFFNLFNKNDWIRDITLIQIIAFIVTFIWFHKGLLYGGGESGLPFYNLSLSVKTSLNIWQNSYLGFPTYYEIPMLPLFLISYLLSIFRIPSFFIQAAINFCLISVGMTSMYFFLYRTVYQEFKYSRLSLFGAVFYFLNLYSMSQVWARGLYMQSVPFASFPLIFLFLHLALNERKKIYFLITLLISIVLPVGIAPSYILSLWLILAILFAYSLIFPPKKTHRLMILFYLILLLLGWITINLWWLSSLILLNSSMYLSNKLTNESLGTLLTISRSSSLFSVIRLTQDSLFNTPWLFSSFYQTIFFQVFSWITPFLAVFSLRSVKRSKFLKLFSIFFIISLFICLGAGFPFGFIFVWIFNSSPIFQVFRNPYEKFGIVLLIFYTPFVTLGFFKLSEILRNRFKSLGLALIYIFLIITFIVLVWPIWTGAVIRTNEPKNLVKVPKYYEQLNKWMDQNNKDKSRIIMLPFLPGEGVTYNWDGNIYSGIDPMINILDYPVISSAMEYPHPKELLDTLYKNIDKIDIANAYGLIRAKFLVFRDDVVGIGKRDLKQEEDILHSIFIPQENKDKMPIICQNQSLIIYQEDHLTLVCQIPDNLSDWSGYRYLHLRVKTDQPAALDIGLRDNDMIRPRWDGNSNAGFRTYSSAITDLFLDLNVYSDPRFKSQSVKSLEIYAYPNPETKDSLTPPTKMEIIAAYLDAGKKVDVDNYRFVEKFDKLRLYQLKKYQDFPEITALSELKIVDKILDMLNDAKNFTIINGKIGYIVNTQNKNFIPYPRDPLESDINIKKLTDYKYFFRKGLQADSYIVLHKNFSPFWKVIIGISEQDLKGGILNDVKLIRKPVMDESNHFIVNGYANLWKIKGSDQNYAIVFMPQLFVNIFLKIALTFFCVLIIIVIYSLVRSRRI